MTSTQKETIALLRTDGHSYGEIANHLGINRDAVISFAEGICQSRPHKLPSKKMGKINAGNAAAN